MLTLIVAIIIFIASLIVLSNIYEVLIKGISIFFICVSAIYLAFCLIVIPLSSGDVVSMNSQKLSIENKITNYSILKNSYSKKSDIDLANNNYYVELLKERTSIVEYINSYNSTIRTNQFYQKNWLWFINIHD